MKPQEKVDALRQELRTCFKERDEEIDGLLVALLSKHHILLIGPRGTAKSLMIRTLASAITGAKYWEKLLTKFSLPEEVLGPIDIKALQESKFQRVIDGHLPTAHFAFCDEIFKCSSSLLNSLLSIINERIFHNDGEPVHVPLECMMGASNEIPTSDASLSALYDRFLIRYSVKYVAEDSAFREMLKMPEPKVSVQITFDEIHQAQQEVASMVTPDSVLEAIIEIRKQLNKEGIIPSDRRYRESIKLVKAYAYLSGCKQVSTDHLSILVNAYWDAPEHIAVVQRVVLSVSNPLQRTADETYDMILSAYKEIQEEKDESKRILVASEVVAKINSAKSKLIKLMEQMKAENRDATKTEGYIKKAEEIVKKKIAHDIMGIKF